MFSHSKDKVSFLCPSLIFLIVQRFQKICKNSVILINVSIIS